MRPLFRALGYRTFRNPSSERLYVFEVRGRERQFYGWQLRSLTGLLEICGDIEHWRLCFGSRHRYGVDVAAACGSLMQLCDDAGCLGDVRRDLIGPAEPLVNPQRLIG